ncbi:hypothetical protein CC86DRAFT_449281 [Ophiobolus disseminans]|uniref:Zn(2)-C6 fungal-type domain-containing protein n=1 Tax=Ophiobolus disseminans TaxID=1469910 RepID=A0A6A6ZJZ0_9PLEO|nr:hypothetical protein CC86DRAFT_449281 [Ophiobolus disseminans]
MSVMDFDFARRYSSQSLSFPDYYSHYSERNVPLTLSQHARSDPRGYPIGGPVGNPRRNPDTGRDEHTMETGSARRRVAVACARCRKRKIRCSGDPGNGSGCSSCRGAGVEAVSCQFHRVGSDSVHKVIDNYQMAQSLTGMANSNALMPIYPATTSNQMYARAMTTQAYPQLDTKTMYSSGWAVPYSEETSPVETYGLEHPAAYLPTPTPIANHNMYGASYRWTQSALKPVHHGSAAYYDQDSSYVAHGLPYIQPNTLRAPATSEALSPLNMSSLSLTLPERPHPRQYNMTEGAAPRRQLPMPQPSPAQTSRNIVDQLQDQRLRCGQAVSIQSTSGGGARFVKPLLPWSTDNETQVNASAAAATSSGASSQMPTATNNPMNFLAAATTMTGETSAAGTASQLQLNFSSSSLLGGLIAPAPVTTYSTFRENRPQGTTSVRLPRHSSQTNLYSFNTDSASKRNSLGNEGNCTLVSGQHYTPLPQQQQHTSLEAQSVQREAFENRNVPPHRSSMGNLNSSF